MQLTNSYFLLLFSLKNKKVGTLEIPLFRKIGSKMHWQLVNEKIGGLIQHWT